MVWNNIMSKKISWLNDSFYTEPLSPACKLCAEGSKMVLLITGLCRAKCYYCPLSLKKIGKDVIYADEWKLNDENDKEKLLLEARYIEAKGAGITGGDPLIVWKRTKDFITFLKHEFGSGFHIHLYTSGLNNYDKIAELVSAGLDEIRFHPTPNYWKKMEKSPIKKSIKKAIETNVDVAIEIPVIPKMNNEIYTLIQWASENEIRWINLNELEFSETNADILNKEGFEVKDDISAAVKESSETADIIIEKVINNNIEIGVHFCSSSFKDGIQLKNRLKRRAKNIAKSYDIITDEGTILKGIAISKTYSLDKIYSFFTDKLNISKKYIDINEKMDRIEIAIWVLIEILNQVPEKEIRCYIVEEYPTADRLEVERIPLPL